MGEPNPQEMEQIADSLAGGRKIEAIKRYREITGHDLKDSKAFIERLTVELREKDPVRFAPKTGRGCLAALLAAVFLLVTLGFTARTEESTVNFSTLKPGEQASSFKIQTRKPADKVELIAAGKIPILGVFSSDGIGSATLIRLGGKWPEKMMVRLNLQHLESIRLRSGTTVLNARLGAEWWTEGPHENPAAKASIRRAGESIEVEVPGVLVRTSGKAGGLRWREPLKAVDCYREALKA